MSLYSDIQQDADAVIAEFGSAKVIRRVVNSFNPVTGNSSESQITESTINCVFLPASGGTVEAFDNRIGESYEQEKLRFVIASAVGLSFTPLRGDKINHEDRWWEIMGSTPVNPAGVTLIYQMGVKLV